jgi:hypothetical protein
LFLPVAVRYVGVGRAMRLAIPLFEVIVFIELLAVTIS